MALLDFLKQAPPTIKLTEATEAEVKLSLEIEQKHSVLTSETSRRVQEYKEPVDFYNGDQRQYRTPDKGRFNKEANLCFPAINTFTSLVAGENVVIRAVPDWETNIVIDTQEVEAEVTGEIPENYGEEQAYRKEYNRKEFLDKHYKKVFGKAFHRQWLLAEHNSSKLGLGVLQWGWNKKEKKPFFASLYPGYVRAAWKTNDFSELSYVFIGIPMAVDTFEKDFGIKVEESDITYSKNMPELNNALLNQFNLVDKVMLQIYLDDKIKVYRIGQRIIPQDGNLFTEHNYGTVPVTILLSNETDDHPLGQSDIKNGIPIQKDYNATLSAWFDVSDPDEGTTIVVPGGNQQTMNSLAQRGSKVVGSIRDGAQPYILARSASHTDIQARINFLVNTFFQSIGLSQTFTNAPESAIITQVAINALNYPTLLRLKPRLAQREEQFERLANAVLKMYENFGGKIPGTKNLTYAQMIDKHYAVDISFKNNMPRDEAVQTQNELFKLDRRIQSRAQTMENLGIENPSEEMDQIAFEEHSPLYSPDRAALERRIALAEAAAAPTRPAGEVQRDALAENQRLAQGQAVSVEETTAREHEIHLAAHTPVAQQVQQLMASNPADQNAQLVLQAFDTHIKEHESKLAALQASGTSGSGAALPGAGQGAFGGQPPSPSAGAFNPPTAQGVQPPSLNAGTI